MMLRSKSTREKETRNTQKKSEIIEIGTESLGAAMIICQSASD